MSYTSRKIPIERGAVDIDGRERLRSLVAERGAELSTLSRMIGRNSAYIQQFLTRGTPRVLAEADRRILGAFFGVAPHELGGLPPPPVPDIVVIPRLDVRASAGHGAVGEGEAVEGRLLVDAAALDRLGLARSASLSAIHVAGDSMVPTLRDGDDLLVDTADAADRLRDGIYVLRVDDLLVVKRIAVDPVGRLSILSDNPLYPPLAGVDPATVAIVGRAVWTGRRL